MSDAPSRGGRSEDAAIERLLAGLEPGADAASQPEDPAERAYLELLGLLGASVEPLAPPPAVKRRLLDRLARPAAAAPVVPKTAPPAPSRRWALPLAASLAVALAGVSGWQAGRLSSQRATIERLSERLAEVEARTPGVAAMRDQLAALHERLALVTGRGVEICALRPMAAESRQAGSRGVLYVAADHQHWYLTIDRLMPCQEGRSYQLWFVPESGEPVSAGTFDVREGVRVELSSETMPAGTRAVTVTLEPAGGSPAPTGPAVLHGDEVMAVL